MTPQEKAVIEEAVKLARSSWPRDAEAQAGLECAVENLIQARERASAAVVGLCNALSTGGSMRCVLPNSHVSDGVVVLHEGRTRNGHARRWKEVR